MSTPTTPTDNETQMKQHFERFKALNDAQILTFAAHLLGSCDAFVCYEFCKPTPENIILAVSRALNHAEGTKP